MKYEITSEIEIDCIPADVYRSLTDEDAIRAWWTNDATMEPDEEADLELGFYNRTIVLRLVIEDTYRDGRVDWRCIEGPAEYQDCTMVFRIEPSGKKTLLEVTHRGDAGSDEFVEHGKQSWRTVLESLKRYLEEEQRT